jgi:hypothetical protein
MAVSFVGGENRSTQSKPLTCQKSLTNFITYFTVSVEPTRYKSQDCFLIHANSHGAIDGVPCGTSITAYVGQNLQTIEQQHHEYIKERLFF